jgi:hypothetical protein
MNEPRKGMKRRWSMGYKRGIDCSHPRGFSQRNYCRRRRRGGKYLEGFGEWLALSEGSGISACSPPAAENDDETA